MGTDAPTREQLVTAVQAAVLAPSVHNSQPWLFRLLEDTVELHGDPTRRLPVGDPTDRELRIACGAAAFNLHLALRQQGWSTAVNLSSARDLTAGPLAVVAAEQPRPPSPAETELYEAIPRRHSNRYPFLDTAVPQDIRAALVAAAREEGCFLALLESPADVAIASELATRADRILKADEAYAAEFAAWVRHDDASGDGIGASAGGPAPAAGDVLPQRDFGGAPRAPGHEFESDPLVGVLGSLNDSDRDALTTGLALQRVLLTATQLGLASSMISQPIDVADVREELRASLHLHGPPQLMLRFGYGAPAPSTPRRPVVDVLL